MTAAELRRRIEALSDEIRHYPTPIARCDLHLPALLEERSCLLERQREMAGQGSCSPEALWANDGGAVA